MRKKIGICCIVLGIACLLGAVSFVLYNQWEEKNAEQFSRDLLEDVQVLIQEQQQEQAQPPEDEDPPATDIPTDIPVEIVKEMATVSVNGYECLGVLSIPVLEIELPVLTDWSYAKLKKAPCHYYGSYYEKDFVIAAHNYKSHFGRLSELQAGDLVIFTDAKGELHHYKVVLLETLPKEATLEMITSGFDLSLYTCTPGGASRVTVRCNCILY